MNGKKIARLVINDTKGFATIVFEDDSFVVCSAPYNFKVYAVFNSSLFNGEGLVVESHTERVERDRITLEFTLGGRVAYITWKGEAFLRLPKLNYTWRNSKF